MQLSDCNPFELFENVVNGTSSINGMQNNGDDSKEQELSASASYNASKEERIIYVNIRWLYHSSSSKMDSHLKKSIESTSLRLDHCWQPRIPQTKRGMAAFLSVLKLLSQEDESIKESVLGRVFTMFCGFPAFLLSLRIALYPKFAAQLTDLY